MGTEHTNPNPPGSHGVPARPFETVDMAHVIARVMQSVNYDAADVDSIIKRAQHVDFGLSAETEFAAICAWLGRCCIIHELGQESLTSLGELSTGNVPDILAVVRRHGQPLTVLIEVKTTEGTKLDIKPEYLSGLESYAKQLSLPLLFAWKSRQINQWTLFDARTTLADGGSSVSLEEAMKQDLMSQIMGDFIVAPTDGAGMTFRMIRAGPPKPTEDGHSQICVVKEVFWHVHGGKRIEHPQGPVMAALLSCSHYSETSTDEEVHFTWSCPEHIATRAQQILRSVVSFRLQQGQRIHWRHVAKNLHDTLDRDALEVALGEAIGKSVHAILHQVPNVWPAWLPMDEVTKDVAAALLSPRPPSDRDGT